MANIFSYIAAKLSSNANPNKKKILQDLELMRAEVQPWMQDLIPLSKSELELLSLSQKERVFSQGTVTTAKAIITSIYEEHMLVYNYKRYYGDNPDALLLVQAYQRQWVYRTKGELTAITINNQPLGHITSKGLFYGARSKRLIGRINRGSKDGLRPILIKDQELAHVVDSRIVDNTIHRRAFDLLSSDLSQEQEIILLSIAIYEIIQNSLQ